MRHPPRPEPSVPVALIYIRVSTAGQERDGLTLEAQLASCRRYVAEHGWILGREYEDIMSGLRDDRPAYRAMLDEARRRRANGEAVVMVTPRIDRFGRSMLESLRSREELSKLGVRLHFIQQGGDIPDFMANLLAAFAQEESAMLGRRVRAVREHLRRLGWRPVGRTPFGYRLRPATEEERRRGAPKSTIEPDPLTAPVVREVFERAARGEAVATIYAWLRSLPAERRGERRLALATVQRMVRSPVYAARLGPLGLDGLDGALGQWQPLVSDDLFRQVQQQLLEHRRVPPQARGIFPLTGVTFCPACGMRMVGHRHRHSRNSALIEFRYVCSGRVMGATAPVPGCSKSVDGRSLEASALRQVGALLDTVASQNAELQRHYREAWDQLRRPERQDELDRQIADAEQRFTRARQLLQDASLKYVDGRLGWEAFEPLQEQLGRDIRAAAAELERLRKVRPVVTLPPLAAVLRQVQSWSEQLASAEPEAQRGVITALIRRLVPERVRRGVYEARIEWTEVGRALIDTAALRDAAGW